ncbi:MAG: rhomboid family intramembrane serine protease [Gammaproteobacteria bacterium]|nr:rhomboid family intramembrane serine protease [Gammaproteobacteria bacterium]
MNEPLPDIAEHSKRMRRSIVIALLFTSVLWDIKLIEMMFGFDWSSLGVYPGRLEGILGIFFAPLLHGSLEHLMANTPASIALLTIVLYGYSKSAKWALPVIYFGTGISVWLFARSSYHIGASGFTFGLMFFVFVIGILRRDRQSIGWSLIVFFMYGGMLGGLFPNDQSISYESHIAGACLGIILAFILKDRDPAWPRKQYSWELEEEAEDDDWEYEYDQAGINPETTSEIPDRKTDTRYLH